MIITETPKTKQKIHNTLNVVNYSITAMMAGGDKQLPFNGDITQIPDGIYWGEIDTGSDQVEIIEFVTLNGVSYINRGITPNTLKVTNHGNPHPAGAPLRLGDFSLAQYGIELLTNF